MTTLDSLPADQRAVLSLLLRQGRSYEQIAETLRISEAAVRERAHGALAALAPADDDLSARRRAEIGDLLLGQGPADERAETQAFLDRSEPGRAWATAVAGALEPLGGDRLPRPSGSATREAAAPAGAEGSRPRVSRVGGAVLLAVAALAIAGVAFVLLRGDDDDPRPERASSTARTAQGQPQIVAQVNLKPPSGAPAAKALGILQVVKQQQQQAIIVQAEGLPKLPSKNSGYGVWLSSSPSKRTWLGYGNYDAEKRQFVATGTVAEDVTAYGEVFITRQSGEGPDRPGTIYLRGAMQAPRR